MDATDIQNAVANVNLDGSTVTMDGVTQELNQQFKDTVTHYLGQGAAMIGDDIAKAEDFVKKLEAVGEDSAMGSALGAGIGSVVPILGTAIGGVIGSWVGGVYGVFDNFGGDIEKIAHDVFNPEDFTPGQYDGMRQKCIASGGLPNPGHAPDNEDGCIYPDGTTSGGDWPRHPAPGVHSVRGDSAWSVFPMPAGMIPDPNGNPKPRFTMAPKPTTLMKIPKNLPKLTPMLNAAALAHSNNGGAPAPAPMPKGIVAPPKPVVKMAIMTPAQIAGLHIAVGLIGADTQQVTPAMQGITSSPDKGLAVGATMGITAVAQAKLSWWARIKQFFFGS